MPPPVAVVQLLRRNLLQDVARELVEDGQQRLGGEARHLGVQRRDVGDGVGGGEGEVGGDYGLGVGFDEGGAEGWVEGGVTGLSAGGSGGSEGMAYSGRLRSRPSTVRSWPIASEE
jgi:hypothetical protein